jgi:hypothetical protein
VLPVPPNLTLPPRGRVRAALAIGGAAFCAVMGGTAAATGHRPWYFWGLTGFLWSVAVYYGPTRGVGVASRGGALVLPLSKPRRLATLLGSAALAAGTAATVGFPWNALVLALPIAVAGPRLRRRGLFGAVTLDPEGVSFDVSGYRRRLPWADVRGVVVGRRTRLVVQAPGESVWLGLDPFAADPLVVYWTLRYYAGHPAARAELADERAVERVRCEDLVDVVERG